MFSLKMFFGLAVLSATALVTACDKEDFSPNDDERTFELAAFERIELGDVFRITLTRGETQKVVARGRRKDLDNLEMEVVDGKLTAHYRPGTQNPDRTKIDIQLPDVSRLELHGNSTTTIRGFEGLEDLRVELSGKSQLDAKMDIERLILSVSGNSEARLEGQAGIVWADISGKSTLAAVGLATAKYAINVSGRSQADVLVSEELTGSVTGDSELRYYGAPHTVEVDVSSDSRMTRK